MQPRPNLAPFRQTNPSLPPHQLLARATLLPMRFRSATRRPSWFVYIPLGAAALLTLGLVLGLGLQRQPGPLLAIARDDQLTPNALGNGAIEEVLRYIEAKYVDPIEREQVVDAAMDALLEQLDPYSSYVSPVDLAAHQARLEGVVHGIGVEVAVWNDSTVVLEVLPDSPAEAAKIQPYDRLLRVGEATLAGPNTDIKQVRQQLRSLGSASVPVAVFRKDAGPLPIVTLASKTLDLPTVLPGLLLESGVGYIRIEQFADNTYMDFMRELDDLSVQHGIRHLVLDLRGNAGGYLHEAVKLLRPIFPRIGSPVALHRRCPCAAG